MICHNPECKGSFDPGCQKEKYCCPTCRTRAKTIRETARKRARSQASTHPCKRCGAPVGYKQILCGNCKVAPYKPGPGITPLNTANIRASRARELELIERVVAKALEGDSNTMTDRKPRLAMRGVKVG